MKLVIPDAGVKQGLLMTMLSDNREEIILDDLACTQLLPDVPGLVFMAQVPDQVLYTLCSTQVEDRCPERREFSAHTVCNALVKSQQLQAAPT